MQRPVVFVNDVTSSCMIRRDAASSAMSCESQDRTSRAIDFVQRLDRLQIVHVTHAQECCRLVEACGDREGLQHLTFQLLCHCEMVLRQA